MRCEGQRRRFYVVGLVLLFMWMLVPVKSYADQSDKIEEAKNGIIGIKSGFTDKSGRFHMIKSSSGFLICNSEGNTYVVTAQHSVSVSDEEKAAYCQEREIFTEENDLTDTIRIMIKGDVNVDASVLTESQVQDYCILSVDSVIQEKSVLRIGEPKDLRIGDPVYVLGFSEEAALDTTAQYTENEVQIHAGDIQDASAVIRDCAWIQHSGVITSGNVGGALLDSEGYLIGLNNEQLTDQEINAYYSLSISEIREVLENYGIEYESKEKDQAYQELGELYERCGELVKSGDYKGESLETLQQNIQTVRTAMEDASLDLDGIREKIQLLKDGESNLVKKMPTSRKMVYILGICCLILLGRVLYLILFLRRKRGMEPKKSKKERAPKEQKKEPEYREKKMESIRPQREALFPDEQKEIPVEYIKKEEETTLLFHKEDLEGDETEVYRPEEDAFLRNARKAELKQLRTGQTISISKPEFFLGKKPELVDYAVTDNKVISRLHAGIQWTDGEYSIQDKGSVNGTYVNGKEVGEEGVILKNGDEIALANEMFVFKEME